MIEGLRHLALVKRQPFTAGALEPVTAERVSAVLFLKFRSGPENYGVVRHVKHGRVADRPSLHLAAGGAVNKDRGPRINGGRERGVAPRPENRCGPRVRIDPREVQSRQREAPVRVVKFGNVLDEKRALRRRKLAGRARDRCAEFEAAIHVGEKRLLIVAGAPVLKVEKAFQMARRRELFEEWSGRFVGGDAGRR